MSRVLALVVGIGKHWLRSREAVFFSLVFPIVLLLIFSAVFASGGATEFTVVVQNNDLEDGNATELSATFIDSLESSDVLNVKRLDAGRDVDEWAEDADLDGATRVLVIHDGFAERAERSGAAARTNVTRRTLTEVWPRLQESTRSDLESVLGSGAGSGSAGGGSGGADAATLTFHTPPDDNSAGAVHGILQQHVAAFNDRVVGVEQEPARIESGTVGDEDLGAVDYFLPALLAAVILINAVITLPQMVSRFGDDGTLKRLVATPLRKWEWLAAHFVVQIGLTLVVVAAMILVARLAFGVTVLPGPLSIVLLLVGTVAFSALGLTIAGWVTDPDAASTLGNLIAFPVLFLSGAFWEIELMPGFLQTVGTALPLYHFHQGLRQLMVVGSMEGVPLAFGVLGTLLVAFTALAVRVTRWRDF